MTTFTKLASLTLNSGDSNARASFIVGSILYIQTRITGGIDNRLIKINLSDFTRVSSLTLPAATYDATWGAFTDGTYAYVYGGSVGGKITKIQLSTMTVVGGILNFNSGEDYPEQCFGAGGYGYCGVWDAFATDRAASVKVVKFSLSAMTRTAAISTPGNIIRHGYTDGTYGYFGSDEGNSYSQDYIWRVHRLHYY